MPAIGPMPGSDADRRADDAADEGEEEVRGPQRDAEPRDQAPEGVHACAAGRGLRGATS